MADRHVHTITQKTRKPICIREDENNILTVTVDGQVLADSYQSDDNSVKASFGDLIGKNKPRNVSGRYPACKNS
jgi:hypothetical protein